MTADAISTPGAARSVGSPQAPGVGARYCDTARFRGLGAIMGIELVRDCDAARPDAGGAAAVVRGCHAEGLVLLACGQRENIVRLLPPLTISDALLEQGLSILARNIARVGQAG